MCAEDLRCGFSPWSVRCASSLLNNNSLFALTPHAHTAAASRPPGRCTAVDLCVHIPLPNRGHHQHFTRISRTSTNTYDDSEMAERGDGAVGGIKSKDIEHLVGFKMG